MKRIKQELVPSLLTAGEWTSWNTKARKVLKENPMFGINPDNIDFYSVRERPIAAEEKLSNEFKAQKNFLPELNFLMPMMPRRLAMTNPIPSAKCLIILKAS